ncbi:MAG TPA: hypothetical protein VLG50_08180 [Candidatus Saccharimonadales bacterium]|nr:hypothetical protein [Candidatus Saccharimonadales bacterium]
MIIKQSDIKDYCCNKMDDHDIINHDDENHQTDVDDDDQHDTIELCCIELKKYCNQNGLELFNHPFIYHFIADSINNNES